MHFNLYNAYFIGNITGQVYIRSFLRCTHKIICEFVSSFVWEDGEWQVLVSANKQHFLNIFSKRTEFGYLSLRNYIRNIETVSTKIGQKIRNRKIRVFKCLVYQNVSGASMGGGYRSLCILFI